MKKIGLMVLVVAFLALPLSAWAQGSPADEEDYSWLYEEEDVVTPPAPAEKQQTPQAAETIKAGGDVAKTEKAFNVFDVYTDKLSKNNHYIPSGWMGDYGDMRFDDGYKTNPHSGNTCIKITYTAEGVQGAGWCGMYWQNPANNWGDREGGYDLTGAAKLTFWARGEKGGEVISEFKTGGIGQTYPDSDSTAIGPITLTPEWTQYTIDLKGLDLSYISGGFCFSASRNDNPSGFVIYLDDIRYE